MFKKIGFATALASTLLFGGAFSSSADAVNNQSGSDAPAYKLYDSVKEYCYFSNQDLNDYFKNYRIDWKQLWKQTPAQDEEKEKEHPQPDSPENGNQDQKTEQQEQTPAPAEPQQPQQPEKPEQPEQEEQTDQLNQFEHQVVQLTNEERTKRGLSPLKVNVELSKVAREKSADMARNNYFSHNSPTYGSPFDMMKQFGISYRTAGENIAKGQRTPQEVVNAWMNSAGHRKNILNPSFKEIGVGYVENGNVWTQQFIG